MSIQYLWGGTGRVQYLWCEGWRGMRAVLVVCGVVRDVCSTCGVRGGTGRVQYLRCEGWYGKCAVYVVCGVV